MKQGDWDMLTSEERSAVYAVQSRIFQAIADAFHDYEQRFPAVVLTSKAFVTPHIRPQYRAERGADIDVEE